MGTYKQLYSVYDKNKKLILKDADLYDASQVICINPHELSRKLSKVEKGKAIMLDGYYFTCKNASYKGTTMNEVERNAWCRSWDEMRLLLNPRQKIASNY